MNRGQLQYIDSLYPIAGNRLKVRDQIFEWLIKNVGKGSHSRDNEIENWAWSLSTYKGCPIGIYFRHDEDKLAFRLAFGIPTGIFAGSEKYG